ncbi:MAG: diguanylate cyclase [Helicobacteraceae bacterium]|nr:diguanylate cyclase [Candidatus Sulfurimonas ponti]MBL6973177.1 diguanylate cyclase [Sulfurimonas sp.]
MKFINKYLFITAIFIVIFISVAVLLKIEVESFAIYEANVKLDRVLTNQKALHGYIEDELKPVIYKLKSEKKLYEEFFNPKVLSFTYIARSVYEIENKLYRKNDKPELYYKLAATNPRNGLNKATEFEQELIDRFNKDKNLREYKNLTDVDGKKYLFFAKPVTPNKASCLKCHSDPEIAPQELRTMYGDVKGFHEKLDDIRAILSIKIPLASELRYGHEYYIKLLSIIFFALLIVYISIIYLLRRLDKKNEALYKLATIDQLTQLSNRREFDKDIYTSIIKAQREKSSLVLLMMDIDHFKNINDTFGHQIGDEILIGVAKIIQNSTREYDKSYRVGGEEFTVILKDIDKSEARSLAARIKDDVETFYSVDKKITLSLGMCEYNQEDDATLFYKKVDDALYRAKENGRNVLYECKES